MCTLVLFFFFLNLYGMLKLYCMALSALPCCFQFCSPLCGRPNTKNKPHPLHRSSTCSDASFLRNQERCCDALEINNNLYQQLKCGISILQNDKWDVRGGLNQTNHQCIFLHPLWNISSEKKEQNQLCFCLACGEFFHSAVCQFQRFVARQDLFMSVCKSTA